MYSSSYIEIYSNVPFAHSYPSVKTTLMKDMTKTNMCMIGYQITPVGVLQWLSHGVLNFVGWYIGLCHTTPLSWN